MPGSRRYYVYILTNRFHSTLYTGMTPDLRRRVIIHKLRSTTCFYNPRSNNKLVYFEAQQYAYLAVRRERMIKAMHRPDLLALISRHNPLWRDLAMDLDIIGTSCGACQSSPEEGGGVKEGRE